MKNLLLIILVGCVVMFTACEEPGTTILFDDEFVEIDAGTTVTGERLYTYLRENDGVGVPSGFEVNLAAAQKSSPVNITFEIDASSTAIENLHYTVSGNSVTIEPNTSIAELPITILDDNIGGGEVYSIVVNLTSADVEIHPEYNTGTHNIQVSCPITASFTGDYSVSYIDGVFPFNGSPKTFGAEGKVLTLNSVSGSNSLRSFSFTYLEELGVGQPGTTVQIDLNCGNVVPLDSDPLGLSCDGATSITMGPSATTGTYNPDDDSEFTLIFDELVMDGGCGAGPFTQTVRFTKVQ